MEERYELSHHNRTYLKLKCFVEGGQGEQMKNAKLEIFPILPTGELDEESN